MGWYSFRPYVSVAQRRAKAAREVARLAKGGEVISPVEIAGRAIATTFWGKAWCDNLESYSDFANRLPRGRTYVRNGSVMDLQIGPGKVTALVSGSEVYRVTVTIEPMPAGAWHALCDKCAGGIGSLVELLQGKLSDAVMRVMTARDAGAGSGGGKGGGLFPAPRQITMRCSCPDWAGMCKHVAATLYGVGARLDEHPELLFALREVDHRQLIERAARSLPAAAPMPARAGKPAAVATIADGDLADVFGIDLDVPSPAPGPVSAPASTPRAGKPRKAGKAAGRARRPARGG